MRNRFLGYLAAAFVLPFAAHALLGQDLSQHFVASASQDDLLKGCTDVPEAVALAEELRDRALRVESYMSALEAKKAEIAAAEASLRDRLAEMKAVKNGSRDQRNAATGAIRDDIDRLIAVYDQMKPAEAAAVLSNLPAEFAAEILMRVQPQTGARIIAAVEPRQAALLTAQMGARSVRTR